LKKRCLEQARGISSKIPNSCKFREFPEKGRIYKRFVNNRTSAAFVKEDHTHFSIKENNSIAIAQLSGTRSNRREYLVRIYLPVWYSPLDFMDWHRRLLLVFESLHTKPKKTLQGTSNLQGKK